LREDKFGNEPVRAPNNNAFRILVGRSPVGTPRFGDAGLFSVFDCLPGIFPKAGVIAA
jgi:hypothetical protein